MRDLDIRGAGDLLGAEQSGFISDIGFDMYQRILADAVRELKEEQFNELFEEERRETGKYVEETVLETDLGLLIPDSYVSDIPERINLYRELDGIDSDIELEGFMVKMEDRFGPIPSFRNGESDFKKRETNCGICHRRRQPVFPRPNVR